MMGISVEHAKAPIRNILSAALRLMARADIETLSMREIAAEAGVSKSLLHYHFRSKDHLLLELAAATVNAIVARVASITNQVTAAGRPDALAASLDAIRRELRGSGDLAAILIRLAARATVAPS